MADIRDHDYGLLLLDCIFDWQVQQAKQATGESRAAELQAEGCYEDRGAATAKQCHGEFRRRAVDAPTAARTTKAAKATRAADKDDGSHAADKNDGSTATDKNHTDGGYSKPDDLFSSSWRMPSAIRSDSPRRLDNRVLAAKTLDRQLITNND